MRSTPHLRMLTVFLIAILALAMAGCSDDDNPTAPATGQAPALPAPELITFDFSFFEQADEIDPAQKSLGEYDNFLNAYVRVALLEVVARIVMTPPVAAFSLALHTPPSLQDDGSWIWVYTFVDGDEEAQIRLRGLPQANGVEWEMRVTVGQLDNIVWFTGTTMDDGETGAWTFRDLEDPAHPESGEIAWGRNVQGDYLRFTCLLGEDDGDSLEFQEAYPRSVITHLDADLEQTSLIEWFSDGHGSLTVPDYNEGARACWDTDLLDAICP